MRDNLSKCKRQTQLLSGAIYWEFQSLIQALARSWGMKIDERRLVGSRLIETHNSLITTDGMLERDRDVWLAGEIVHPCLKQETWLIADFLGGRKGARTIKFNKSKKSQGK